MSDTTVGSCPKCDAEIPLTATECPDCKTKFGPGSMWKVKPVHRTSAASSTPSVAVPGGNCWRQDKVLGLRRGTDLPHRCLKCNEPAQEPVGHRSMTWHHPGWYLLIPIGILVYVIVALIVRTRADVPVPLCAKHKFRHSISLWIAWGGSIIGILTMFGGGALVLVGFVLLLTGIGFGLFGARDVYPARLTSSEIYLKGCSWELLKTIPEGRPSEVEPVSLGGGGVALAVLAVVGIFVIGVLAAIALPAYHDYVARARVTEAIASAAPWRQAVEAHFAETKRFPRDASELRGAPPPPNSWVSLAGGILTLTMTQGDAIAGKTVVLRPVLANRGFQWDCTGGTVGQRYRPANCRSANPAQGPQWSVHSHPEDGFQAEFSGDVSIAPQKLDAQTMARITRSTEYVQDNGSSAYFVLAVLTKNGPTLTNAANSIARMGCKTILRDSEVPFPSGKGRLIQATDCNNDLRAEARYFATGMWFYQVLALVPKNGGDLASAQHFVGSFKVAK